MRFKEGWGVQKKREGQLFEMDFINEVKNFGNEKKKKDEAGIIDSMKNCNAFFFTVRDKFPTPLLPLWEIPSQKKTAKCCFEESNRDRQYQGNNRTIAAGQKPPEKKKEMAKKAMPPVFPSFRYFRFRPVRCPGVAIVWRGAENSGHCFPPSN